MLQQLVTREARCFKNTTAILGLAERQILPPTSFFWQTTVYGSQAQTIQPHPTTELSGSTTVWLGITWYHHSDVRAASVIAYTATVNTPWQLWAIDRTVLQMRFQDAHARTDER